MDPDPYIGTTFYFDAKPQVEDAPRGGNGSQVLPVAELDDDFEGDPEDGMEYLFLVRREAATHARVYRASLNPYATVQEEASTRRAIPERVHSSRPSEEWRKAFIEKFKQTRMRMVTPPPASSLPHIDSSAIPAPRQESAWRIFVNGKRSKPVKPPAPPSQASTTPTTQPHPQSTAIPKPSEEDSEMTDLESAKAAILASLELDTPEPTNSPPPAPPPLPRPAPSAPPPTQIPEFDKLPQLPTPSLILSIPLTSIIHILSHFNEWFMERLETYDQELNWVSSTIFAPPAVRRKPGGAKVAGGVGTKEKEQEKKKRNAVAPLPTPHEVHWMLSLLSRLNDLLDGDDLSNLRLLAKTLVDMVEASEKAMKKALSESKRERTMDERREGDEEDEARARCWMVIAAIAGVWKQEDLWNVNL